MCGTRPTRSIVVRLSRGLDDQDFVANSLNRIIDRAIQVHGASAIRRTRRCLDAPTRSWARLADGADEIHQMRIGGATIAAFKDSGSTSWRRVIAHLMK